MRSSQRFFRAAVAAALLTSSLAFASVESTSLASHVWIHGAVDCSESRDPAIETFKVDEDTYILRQSKCVDYEAPFIYVLFGEQTVLVQDTGATSEADKFPLYDTVAELVRNRSSRTETALEVLVIHSHSHGDHTAADAQFRGKPNVTVVAPGKRGLEDFLSSLGTEDEKLIDLGGRVLTIFRVPGHQSESVAIYDPHTTWLLTGDTVYPGIISVLDWEKYRASVEQLVDFSKTHEISAVLGSHIEMSQTPGVPYERGSTFQQNEASLVLPVAILTELKRSLDKAGGKRQELNVGSVIVRPVPFPARVLIRTLKFFGVGG
jgi:glyoxylase-like metal-dependent hydrolase (beta-lactamase superfamily II)